MINSSKIRKGAILAAVLALLVVFTQIPFASSAATYTDDTGNLVLYEGASTELDTIKYVGGTKDVDFTVGIASMATRYGNAISLKAKRQASGWAEFSTAAATSIQGAIGVAMYVKLPNATNTDIGFRMIDTVDGIWGNWSSMPGDCKVTYVDPDDIANPIVKYEIPGRSMPGFEGFIFVEFAELDGNAGQDYNWLPENYDATKAHIAISPYWDNNTSADSTFYFDNIGFYSDIDGFIKLVNTNSLGSDVIVTSDFANSFVPSSLRTYYTNNGSWVNSNTQVQLSDFNGTEIDSVSGKAWKFTLPTTGTVDGCVGFLAPSNVAIGNGKVQGVAAYIEFPDVDGSFQLEPIVMNANDYGTVLCAGMGGRDGCKTTYVALDGTVTVKTSAYPGEGMAGFKGYMFIDGSVYNVNWGEGNGTWQYFVENYNAKINDANNPGRLGFQLSCWKESHFYGKSYVIDNLGFYSDIQTYLDIIAENELTEKASEKIAFKGDSITGVKLSEPTNIGQAWSQADSSATAYGSAVAFYNDATGANCNGGIMFPLYGAVDTPAEGKYFPNRFDLTDAKGIAFYLSIPERQSTAMYIDILYKNWGSNTEGGYAGDPNCRIAEQPNITYYPIDGAKFTRNNTVLVDLNGFEGFVFIPFTEFSQWGYPLSDASKLAYYDLNQLAIRFMPWINDGSTDLNKKFYLSNLGFYSDPAKYMALAKNNIDAVITGGDEENGVNITAKDGLQLKTGKEYTDANNNDVYVFGWTLGGNPVTNFTAGNYASEYKANFFNTKTLKTFVQKRAAANGEADKSDVRLVSSIDAKYDTNKYEKLGFIISYDFDPTYESQPTTYYTETIREGIYDAATYKTAPQIYNSDYSKYVFNCDIFEVANDESLNIRAFVELSDGTKIYGDLKTIDVSEIQ